MNSDNSYCAKTTGRSPSPAVPISHPRPTSQPKTKTTAAKPARGKIIEVIDSSTAWVNLGSAHGTAVGSTLTNGKRKPTTYVFQRIYERQSIAYVRSGDAPRLGDAVTALTEPKN